MSKTELDATIASYVHVQMDRIRNAYDIQKYVYDIEELLLPEYMLQNPTLSPYDGVLHTEIVTESRYVALNMTATRLQARFGTTPIVTNFHGFRLQPTYPDAPETAAIEYNYENNTCRKMIAVYEAIDNRPTLLWHPETGVPTPATIESVVQEIKLFLWDTQT